MMNPRCFFYWTIDKTPARWENLDPQSSIDHDHGKTHRNSHGKVGKSWENLWENGKIIGKLMGKWENHGKTYGIQKKNTKLPLPGTPFTRVCTCTTLPSLCLVEGVAGSSIEHSQKGLVVSQLMMSSLLAFWQIHGVVHASYLQAGFSNSFHARYMLLLPHCPLVFSLTPIWIKRRRPPKQRNVVCPIMKHPPNHNLKWVV